MKVFYLLLCAVSISILFQSCESQPSPIRNFEIESEGMYVLDMHEGITQGLCIPQNQSALKTSFWLYNTTDVNTEYAYKVYYRNERYKHDLINHKSVSEDNYNRLASNNFYGSWEDPHETFRTVNIEAGDSVLIEMDLKIWGNPRDEKQFYGAPMRNDLMRQEDIDRMRNSILNNETWLADVQHKANENQVTLEEQLEADITWTIQMQRKEGNENNRWQRNPRMGEYSVLLAVVPSSMTNKIPYYIGDITRRDSIRGCFVDPYYYWQHQAQNDNIDFDTHFEKQVLSASLEFTAQKGLYVDPIWINKLDLDTTYLDAEVGFGDDLFQNAPFEQFFSADKSQFKPQNVNAIANVGASSYTMETYFQNLESLAQGNTAERQIGYTDYPGMNAGYDHEKKALYYENSGNQDTSKLEKDNVGIRSRVGLTYGKYTAKVQFPAMLSNEGVWNGLTNAFWLIYQDDAPWNIRGTCENGYIVPNSFADEIQRASQHNYSEIDIEIVKTGKYWPKTSYRDSTEYKVDDALNNNVIITCTNWDLACPDPSQFHTGVRDISYNDTVYTTHRWDHNYKAITSKYEYPHDLTVGRPLYYQIEWLPTEIIWRIGESAEDMTVVGYMDTTITSVPDNQMILAITQEFHDGDWWPTAPFKQNAVPFPKDPLSGYLWELKVE